MKDLIDARIASARARLAANLGELQDRVTHARELVSPKTYLQHPWFKVGAVAAIGYLVSATRRPKLLTNGTTQVEVARPSFLHEIGRLAVTALAGALIARILRAPRQR